MYVSIYVFLCLGHTDRHLCYNIIYHLWYKEVQVRTDKVFFLLLPFEQGILFILFFNMFRID